MRYRRTYVLNNEKCIFYDRFNYILDPSLESALFKLGLDPEPGGREGQPQSALKQGQLTDIG